MQVVLTFFAATVVVLWIAYGALSDTTYRSPKLLLLAGVAVALVGSVIKGVPIALKLAPFPIEHPELFDLATLLVDPLVGGIAGGLVASAVLLRLQIMNAEAQAAARENYQFASDDLKIARAHLRRTMAGTSPDGDAEGNRAHAFEWVFRARSAMTEAEKRLDEVNVPGLGELYQPHLQATADMTPAKKRWSLRAGTRRRNGIQGAGLPSGKLARPGARRL